MCAAVKNCRLPRLLSLSTVGCSSSLTLFSMTHVPSSGRLIVRCTLTQRVHSSTTVDWKNMGWKNRKSNTWRSVQTKPTTHCTPPCHMRTGDVCASSQSPPNNIDGTEGLTDAKIMIAIRQHIKLFTWHNWTTRTIVFLLRRQRTASKSGGHIIVEFALVDHHGRNKITVNKKIVSGSKTDCLFVDRTRV